MTSLGWCFTKVVLMAQVNFSCCSLSPLLFLLTTDVEDRFPLSLQKLFLYLIAICHISVLPSLFTLFRLSNLSELAHSPLVAHPINCLSFLVVLSSFLSFLTSLTQKWTLPKALSKLSRLGICAPVNA